MDVAGNFAVTWRSNGRDGSSWTVAARTFNSAGAAVQANDFVVNQYTTSHQQFPAVAMDADGDFVVAWQSYEEDGSNYGIYARRYNLFGDPLTGAVDINGFTTSSQVRPEVATDAAGNFVVSWESFGQAIPIWGVYARRFNAFGDPLASEFLVNTTTTVSANSSDLGMNAAGNFVVTWRSTGEDGSGLGVYARTFNAAGTAQQPTAFRVNSHTTGDQQLPTVAMDASGDFVVAWQSDGQDGSGQGIYAQRFLDTTPRTVTAVASQIGEAINPTRRAHARSQLDPCAILQGHEHERQW